MVHFRVLFHVEHSIVTPNVSRETLNHVKKPCTKISMKVSVKLWQEKIRHRQIQTRV